MQMLVRVMTGPGPRANCRGVVRTAGGVEDGAGLGQGGVDLGVVVAAWSPVGQQRFGFVPVGVAACGEGLADPGWSEAEPDGAVAPDGVGELGEAAVLLGDDEAGLAHLRSSW